MAEYKNYTEDEIMSALSTCLDITDGKKCCDNCVFNGQPACTCDLFQEVVELIKDKNKTIDEFKSKYIKQYYTRLSVERKIEALLCDLHADV
jgi:hypothetical protein